MFTLQSFIRNLESIFALCIFFILYHPRYLYTRSCLVPSKKNMLRIWPQVQKIIEIVMPISFYCITNQQRFTSLKQQTFIISWLYRLEIWAESRIDSLLYFNVVAGLIAYLETLGKNLLPISFRLLAEGSSLKPQV